MTTPRLRAKFACRRKTTITDREFFRYTPSSSIVLGVVSPTTAGAIEIDRDYYVDFTPAEEAP